MGTSASILFESGKSIPIKNIIYATEKFCLNLKLFYNMGYEEKDENYNLKYISVNISDIMFVESTGRQLVLNLSDEPCKFKDISFDWNNQKVFFEAIVFEEFYQNEDLLFIISFEYLKVYPEAKLWIEEDWLYTLSDLEKIASKPFDKEWCYKNPKLL